MSQRDSINEGIISGTVDILMTYKFLRLLTTPFEKTKAFKLGLMDKDGNLLKRVKEMKPEEKKHVGIFNRMIWKIRKLIAKVSFGHTKIASYAAALWFIKESRTLSDNEFRHLEIAVSRLLNNHNTLTEDVECGAPIKINETYSLTNTYLSGNPVTDFVLTRDEVFENALLESDSVKIVGETNILGIPVYTARTASGRCLPVFHSQLATEDAPVNNASSGNIAGLPPDTPPMTKGEVAKNLSNTESEITCSGKLMGKDIYDVDSDKYWNCIKGYKPKFKRYNKYVGDDPTGKKISSVLQKRTRSNPENEIILKDKTSGFMAFFKKQT